MSDISTKNNYLLQFIFKFIISNSIDKDKLIIWFSNVLLE